MIDLYLWDVVEEDLPIFYTQQLDADALHMAAFTSKDPTDQAAFLAHWHRILADPTVIAQTILYAGQIAGYVLSYEWVDDLNVYTGHERVEVSYWIDKAFWGRGVATAALARFLAEVNSERPICARVAKDNLGSRRVLEKCGFTVIGEDKGFANARNAEIEELILELRA